MALNINNLKRAKNVKALGNVKTDSDYTGRGQQSNSEAVNMDVVNAVKKIPKRSVGGKY